MWFRDPRRSNKNESFTKVCKSAAGLASGFNGSGKSLADDCSVPGLQARALPLKPLLPAARPPHMCSPDVGYLQDARSEAMLNA